MTKKPGANLRPPVRTTEEARALAALGAGRPSLGVKAVSVKLGVKQLEQLDALKINRSELIRRLLDEWLEKQA